MISLENLVVGAGTFRLSVDQLQLAASEYVALFGPTGSGKTLLLESIAGLRKPLHGRVVFGEVDVTHVPAEQRRVGFVRQEYLLFPNLSVAGNIGFGVSRQGRQARVRELATALRIEHLLDRKPCGLSGGEQQRVALARALAIEPEVLLLDEPFSALDAQTREELRLETRRMHAEFRPAVLHVTHDLDEAVAVADRIAVVVGGTLAQFGSVDDVLARPATAQVARATGTRNVIPGLANGHVIALDDGPLLRTVERAQGRVFAAIRPEHIGLSRFRPPADTQVFVATVTAVEMRSSLVLVRVHAGAEYEAYLIRREHERLALQPGDAVYVTIKPEDVCLCPG